MQSHHPQQHITPLRINHNTWARTDKKVTAFAEHLATVFQPFPFQMPAMEEETILRKLNAPNQMALPMKKIRIHEVTHIIQYKIIPKRPQATTLSPEIS
jgi:hypothetical protein